MKFSASEVKVMFIIITCIHTIYIYIYQEDFAQQYRKCGTRSGSPQLSWMEQGPDFWCWFDTTQFSYHCVHPIHAKMFSIQMLLHFSQIVRRVCTLVLFIYVVQISLENYMHRPTWHHMTITILTYDHHMTAM